MIRSEESSLVFYNGPAASTILPTVAITGTIGTKVMWGLDYTDAADDSVGLYASSVACEYQPGPRRVLVSSYRDTRDCVDVVNSVEFSVDLGSFSLTGGRLLI